MEKLYQALLLDHYRNPRNAAVLQEYSSSAQQFNPLCGDSVAVQVQIKNGVVTAIGFQAVGCVISIASASLLSELMLNKSLDTICALGENEVRTLVGVSLGPTRLKCALLALHAVQEAISSYFTAMQ